ncbi:hypothetical protein ACSFBI_22175 [Variovorax sp. RB3P1]|uniref:hypothetical protein n=1 Tax=Variovorax sp. RB3P1 TaxID=3443732 RepID=UPI003F45CB1D
MVKPIGREAETPSDIFLQLVRVAGEDILVGGQALALWVEHYGVAVPEGVAAISRDVDFLTDSPTSNDSVTRYAKALHGKTFFPSRRAMTSLVGQAFLLLPEEEYINVDVLWSLIGLTSDQVRARAVTAYRADASFQVMHELHVLRSRLINLHRLKEKQNDKGEMQLRLAIDVAREFLREEAAKHDVENIGNGRSPLQPLFKEIALLASDDAGQKVTKRHGIHVADALDPSLIPAGPFWERQWPRLATLMSPAYRARFVPPQRHRDD